MTADTVGGVWTYAVELAAGLRRLGVRVALATMGGPASPGQREQLGDAAELFESDYRLEWMDSPWEDVRAAGEWLLRLEREWRPNVVHLNNYAHGALAWRAATLIVGHSCVYSWFAAVRGEWPPAETWSRYRREVGDGLAAVDAVTAPTQAMLNELRRHYGAFRGGQAIHNGRSRMVDAEWRLSNDERSPRGEPSNIVLTVGRLWDEAKNAEAVDAAAGTISWPVYAAGATAAPGGACCEFRHLRPLGQLDPSELSAWYKRAAIFVSPARYEPFGLAALEAAQSGAALVLGDLPTLREVWGDAAVFVPPNDHAALAKAIRFLIDYPAARREYQQRAELRSRRYTSECMADAYMALYRRLLTQRRKLSGGPRRAGHTSERCIPVPS